MIIGLLFHIKAKIRNTIVFPLKRNIFNISLFGNVALFFCNCILPIENFQVRVFNITVVEFVGHAHVNTASGC